MEQKYLIENFLTFFRSANDLPDANFNSVLKWLEEKNDLKKLSLAKNHLKNESIKKLFNVLEDNPALTSLDLSYNKIDDENAIALGNVLTRKENKIKRLSLTNCGISAEGGKVLATALWIASKWTNVGRSEPTSGRKLFEKKTDFSAEVRLIFKLEQLLPTDYIKFGDRYFQLSRSSVLTSLNLEMNRVGPEGAKAFADALRVNTVLIKLNLYENYIKDDGAIAICKSLQSNQSLQELDLGENSISSYCSEAFADALRANTVLIKLNLYGNSIKDEGAIAICKSLRRNKSLQELNLGRNGIASDGANALKAALSERSAVLKIVLNRNSIGDEGASALGEALKNKTLKELGLMQCRIGPDGGKALAAALSEGSAVLTKLVLTVNQIKDEGAIALGEALKTNKTLKELVLRNCGIGVEGGKALASALSEGSAVLTRLYIGENFGISGEAAQQLAAAVLGSKTLEVLSEIPIKEIREDKHTKLSFLGTALGPTEGLVLAALIQGSAVLTSLNLEYNNVGPEGAKALADALRVNRVLTSLNLAYNALCGVRHDHGTYDASGVTALAEALKVNRVLTSLNLRNNRIGPEGAKALADALRVNAVLTSLSVAENPGISREAAQQFAAAVLGSKTLEVFSQIPIKEIREDKHTELNLWNIGLGAVCLGAVEAIVLAALIQGSRVLTSINLRNNRVGLEGAKALANALRVNAVLTKLSVQNNRLGGEAKKALRDAAEGREGFELII